MMENEYDAQEARRHRFPYCFGCGPNDDGTGGWVHVIDTEVGEVDNRLGSRTILVCEECRELTVLVIGNHKGQGFSTVRRPMPDEVGGQLARSLAARGER